MRTKKKNELEERISLLEERISLLEEHMLKQNKLIGDITDLLVTMTENLKSIYNITFLHKN